MAATPDASDPGDFISASDASDPNLQAACGPHLFEQNSSWHGTRVAGIVGAAGNNSIGWAFYTPALPDSGAAHAASNGYAFLTTVNSGEGFWVNAKQDFSMPIGSGNLRATTAFKDGTGPGGANPLPQGWSLIAVGDNPTPRTFTNGITTTPPAVGIAAATNLTTLWAWYPGNNVQQPGWFFYAPALDNSGELGSYIGAKGYLDFATLGKFLDATTGFWVNRSDE